MRDGRLSWLSRGMGAAQAKKVARPRCGIDHRGAADEAAWEHAKRSIKENPATSAQTQNFGDVARVARHLNAPRR